RTTDPPGCVSGTPAKVHAPPREPSKVGPLVTDLRLQPVGRVVRRNTARVSQVRKIRVVGASGSRVANVAFGTVADQCHLTVTLDDGRTVSADASDYFESLLLVRRELEHDGLLVCCQGARRDVWPSGMARDMGAGLEAYV